MPRENFAKIENINKLTQEELERKVNENTAEIDLMMENYKAPEKSEKNHIQTKRNNGEKFGNHNGYRNEKKFGNHNGYEERYRDTKKSKLERAVNKLVLGISDFLKGTLEKKIADALRDNKISQIVIHAKENYEPGLEKGLTFQEDIDTRTALFLLNDFNKKPFEEIYEEGAITSLIPKGGSEKNLTEERGGLRIFFDVGGSWMELKEDGKTTTIRFDHHGPGKRDPTSATKMIYEMMKKADILKETPEWLDKFVNFVNEMENLTYMEDRDGRGRKIFNENYFRNQWSSSLYAIAEKNIPYETLIELCESGKIKNPSIPFTYEELNGEIGKTKIGKHTIKELCEQEKKEVEYVLTYGIKNAIKYAKSNELNLNTKSLGKIIYHNYPKLPNQRINTIDNNLAFKATKAKGYDTFISWNKKRETFFINSSHPNLSNIAEKLNEADSGCAIDVRGTLIFGKIKKLTEQQFLDIIDPKISENKDKKLNGHKIEQK